MAFKRAEKLHESDRTPDGYAASFGEYFSADPDLFEGLCVGHAPRKCPICGTWFLTTDARPTEYCGGLAPGDKRGRTCRQVGNLRGREQREQADDHPLKKVSQPDCAVCTSAYHTPKELCDCFWAELQVYSQAAAKELGLPVHLRSFLRTTQILPHFDQMWQPYEVWCSIRPVFFRRTEDRFFQSAHTVRMHFDTGGIQTYYI